MSIGTILLLILKGIGLLLLGLLGLAAVLILLFLFLPFSYAAQGDYAGTLSVRAKFSWLFHILGIRVYYNGAQKEDDLRWQFLVLGIPLLDSIRLKKKEALKEEKLKEDSRRNKETRGIAKSENSAEKQTTEHAAAQNAEALDSRTKNRNADSSRDSQNEETEKAGAKRKPKKRESLRKHIRYTFRTICDKIKQIWENLSYYRELLQREETRQAFALCRDQLLRLLKHIRPRQFQARLILGTGDPAFTGQLAACYGMAFPFIGEMLEFTPDFERKVLEGDFRLSGRITMYRIIRTAWILYFDKNIRTLLHYLQKEDREHV